MQSESRYNVGAKTMKLLQENLRPDFCDFSLGSDKNRLVDKTKSISSLVNLINTT